MFSSFKVRRSRDSSEGLLLVSRMIKSLPSHPVPGETSGSVAANRTSSPANREERSTSRTLTTTPPLPREPPKPARSTLLQLEKTCVVGRSSFTMFPASLSSRWCLTSTLHRGAYSATSRVLSDPEDPNRRPHITGSSCLADSVTPYQCRPNYPALRSFTSPLPFAPTMVLLTVTPVSCPQLFQVGSVNVCGNVKDGL